MPSFARLLDICCGPNPTGNFFPMPISPLLEHKIGYFVRFCQQVSSRWLPRPATNLIWRRSTPVWLAIWRTWAGFANSPLQRTAFRCIYSYMCTHPRYCRLEPLLRHSKSVGPSAPIAYATSVSPPNEAAAWPGGAGVGWQMLLLVVRGTVPANHRARFQNANTS